MTVRTTTDPQAARERMRQARAALVLPQQAVWPDYGAGGLLGQIADDAAFIARPLSADATVRIRWIVDGLGDDWLQRHGGGSALLAARRGRLTSVFPSTTASAMGSVLSGLAPCGHGLTGWWIHDRRFGGVMAPLPLSRRDGRPLRALRLVSRLFPYDSVFCRSRRPCTAAWPAKIADSCFTARHARGAVVRAFGDLDELVALLVTEARRLQAQGGGYVLAYHDRFDALSHRYGVDAVKVVTEFGRIDAAFARLCRQLPAGCEIRVTADHGFIDNPSSQQMVVDAAHPLATMLAAPLFGERRAVMLRLRPGALDDCLAWAATQGEALVAQPSAQLIEAGLFGEGVKHRRLPERVGEVCLLMQPGWTLYDVLPDESPVWMPGVHGGLSPAEMGIPDIRYRHDAAHEPLG